MTIQQPHYFESAVELGPGATLPRANPQLWAHPPLPPQCQERRICAAVHQRIHKSFDNKGIECSFVEHPSKLAAAYIKTGQNIIGFTSKLTGSRVLGYFLFRERIRIDGPSGRPQQN